MPRSRSLSLLLAALFVMNFVGACSNSGTKTPAQSADARAADEAAIRAACERLHAVAASLAAI
jgi:hypothetical protein